MNSDPRDLSRRLLGLEARLGLADLPPAFEVPRPDVIGLPVDQEAVRVFKRRHIVDGLEPELEAEVAAFEAAHPAAVAVVVTSYCDCPACQDHLAANEAEYWSARGGRPETKSGYDALPEAVQAAQLLRPPPDPDPEPIALPVQPHEATALPAGPVPFHICHGYDAVTGFCAVPGCPQRNPVVLANEDADRRARQQERELDLLRTRLALQLAKRDGVDSE